MSKPREPDPVKLFVSVIAADRGRMAEVIGELAGAFGQPDFVSEVLPFEYTDYYTAEMGTGLVRRFVTFERLIRPEELPAVKLCTNALEERFSEGGARRVNIDPGYVARQHFILATGKGYSHRPYIGRGIYADLTLEYRRETYRPFVWTYPDYRAPETLEMLNGLRKRYVMQLKNRQKA
ncbi:MAG: DUF4416 family protein [Syntrophobacterales bacterium]|nr:DUF4416 family protein [Syntrophobacterales bacterium]